MDRCRPHRASRPPLKHGGAAGPEPHGRGAFTPAARQAGRDGRVFCALRHLHSPATLPRAESCLFSCSRLGTRPVVVCIQAADFGPRRITRSRRE
ncbi:hypothetical protein E2C01_008413 [Portunus trituberculatus]|uniref:Uncharacterized protein n=1 Tax=Portunus trituberculatus TaxID=210409 RepID=A0A5B7D2T0_PORTR|nr:hypothetical protein [Portunus trituberculatus]